MTYLDAAAGVPLHPAAKAAWLTAVDDGWADPQKLYAAARRARLLLDAARESVAAALGARPDEVSFAASGTQALQLGLLGVAGGRRRRGSDSVASAVEHSAVLHTLETLDGTRTLARVDRAGRVDPAAFAAALTDATAVACLQTANHEVGTVQPVVEVAQACHRRGVPLVVDAAQSVGRVRVDVAALGASALTASAHKWGGPPGVGVLVVRKGTRWAGPLPYDEREGGRVPGFVDLPGVVAAAAALTSRLGEMEEEAGRLSALVERIRTTVPQVVPDVEVVGDPVQRLPHIVTFSCLYVDGEALLHALDTRGFAVSSGSSCTSSALTPSHVLEAMGVLSHGNVRVSLHRDTTDDDVDRFLAVLPEVVADLRDTAGVRGL